jgi:hypothetical protein
VQADVIVIGGGAAGLFCALTAGRRGRRVVVVEHNDRVGKKIRISGGGRCNFTNLHTTHANFISANPHFCKSALARYTPADFVALVESHGVAYYEKKLGQLFCAGSAQQIIDLLVEECRRANVRIECGRRVHSLARGETWRVETGGKAYAAESIVIATGGLSIPTLGGTDFGYRLARQFGLKVQPTRPALVPLTLDAAAHAPLGALSGVSFPAEARCGGIEFKEDVLLTHRGLSGPAILQVSSYWRPGESIELNLLPGRDALDLLMSKRLADVELANLLGQQMPRRLAQAWCDLVAPSRPLKQFGEAQLTAVAARLQRWSLRPSGTEGYKKAEVTVGGVDTAELSSKTMEAQRVPGLYFIGEVVDVTGHLGGHNFQWAWSSGHVAGQYA